MRVLLDTNAWTMGMTDDPRLPVAARQMIAEAQAVYLSAISVYEIGQKVRLGKWPEMAGYIAELLPSARTAHYAFLPVTADVSLEASLIEWDHRDPFDRIIGATARREELTLVSSDEAFDRLEGVTRLWA